MNLYPFRSEEVGNDELPIFYEYAWDFENDCNIIEDGELKRVSHNEALKVWAYKALKTERYRYLSFSWQHGSELESVIGKVFSKDELEKELKNLVGDALLSNAYILELKDFDVDRSDEVPVISFLMKTIYGEVVLDV